MDNQQQPDQIGYVPQDARRVIINSGGNAGPNPLPHQSASDTPPTATADMVGHRPTPIATMSDGVGQRRTEETEDVGHDPDLPARSDRHTLSTYEAARMFEEAECRVSERTVIRWCNKNKRGNRRLDCSFDPDERKYYIAEDSVKGVIREERNKGRQSDHYNPDLSDIEETTDKHVGHRQQNDGQRPTRSDERVGQAEKVSDGVRQPESPATGKEPAPENENRTTLLEENTKLKIEMAKLEEQARTKDEMMTFLRKEIDRRGDQITQDRETYDKSLDWFRTQVTAKDAVIERLNTEMRGLLEAPRHREQHVAEEPTRTSQDRYAPVRESSPTTPTEQGGRANG